MRTTVKDAVSRLQRELGDLCYKTLHSSTDCVNSSVLAAIPFHNLQGVPLGHWVITSLHVMFLLGFTV